MIYEGRYFDGSHVYVMKGATGAGTGVDWANAYTTINAAITAGLSAGDILHIATLTLKTGTPPPTIDAEEFAEDVQFQKGILIIGHPGHGGTVGDDKNSHVRITGYTAVSDATPIMELGEGSILSNVRLEARTVHRTAAYFKFYSSTKLVNSSIGGISFEDTVDCILTDGSFIEFKNSGFGFNNIAASKTGIRAQSGLSLDKCSFGQFACNAITAENDWIGARECVFRNVPILKSAIYVATGKKYHTAIGNIWSGIGEFITFQNTGDRVDCAIKNNENIILETKAQSFVDVDTVGGKLALITSAVAGKFLIENVSGGDELRLNLYDYNGNLKKTFNLKNPASTIITQLLKTNAIVEREEFSP